MMERFRYTDHTKPQRTDFPTVDVVMIQVRQRTHKWVQDAVDSVNQQTYQHMGLLELDNIDRSASIGACWNACVRKSTADLVLMMGDDDMLAVDLVECMVLQWMHMRAMAPNVVHITTHCTAFDDETQKAGHAPVMHTGMFLRQFLVDHPFDESLVRHVGAQKVAAIAEAQKHIGQSMTSGILHNYGYIFRQHPWMVSGKRINVR